METTNLADVQDFVSDDLRLTPTTHDALVGFCIHKIEPGIGPEGVTVLYGSYLGAGSHCYAIGISRAIRDADVPTGIQYYKAALNQ